MKNALKILITLSTILILLTSIYYGLRIFHTPYTYEYTNNSLVVTLPNKVWFEINNQQDTIKTDDKTTYIFQNDLTDKQISGYNYGLQYPKYYTKIQNNQLTKTSTIRRDEDTITIETNIQTTENLKNNTYTTQIAFSQKGTFKEDTYTQEGCDIETTTENGTISYYPETATLKISYDMNEKKNLDDTINIEISCYKR